MKKIFCLLCLICLLPSCVAVVGGAAVGAAGATVLYDRRDISSMYKDEKISYQIVDALQANKSINRQCHIVVATYHRVVLLAGQTPTEQLRQKVVSIAKKIPGIQRLYNEITIQAPSSTLTRTSDTWITAKVKSILLGTKNLSSGQFKVVTENGVVYLMGLVNRTQANLAVNATRRVDGVQKVVKIFQYKRGAASSYNTNRNSTPSDKMNTSNHQPVQDQDDRDDSTPPQSTSGTI